MNDTQDRAARSPSGSTPMTKITAVPWVQTDHDGCEYGEGDDAKRQVRAWGTRALIARFETVEDAARTVECVNACATIPTNPMAALAQARAAMEYARQLLMAHGQRTGADHLDRALRDLGR